MDLKKLLLGCVCLVFSPVILVVALLFLAIYLLSIITCIGPIIQALFTRYDESKYQENLPNGVRLVRTPGNYRLALRWSEWSRSSDASIEESPLLSHEHTHRERRCPVVIPNGLAATLGTTAKIHDALVNAGFRVLSFDRLGVGYSDANLSGNSPTVQECVEDAIFCMNHVLPQEQQWILIGPSMGATVCQCIIAAHPNRVAGFLNMDGFAAAFECKREKFLSASKMWKFISNIAWTGILRAGLFVGGGGLFDPMATTEFSADRLKAQMNRKQFFANTSLEFPLMLDLAASATSSWAALGVAALSDEEKHLLMNVRPAHNGRFENRQWTEMPRSTAELGDGWLSDEEAERLIVSLRSKSQSPLARTWSRLPVRVMLGRDYDYAGGDSFYDEEMKMLAAAESALHALLAADGRRYIFPHIGHNKMFFEVDAIVQCTVEIDDAVGQ